MIYFQSDLPFSVWDYRISHPCLLIRSPRDHGDARSVNIDVSFAGIWYSELAIFLEGMLIRDADSDEVNYLRTRIASVYFNERRCYAIVSGDYTYFVVGGHITIETTSLDRGLVRSEDISASPNPQA